MTVQEQYQCLYCGRKTQEIVSDEHVLPRAIGGNLQPTNPFKLKDRVCRNCNSLCGLFVDGPVSKSWFWQNANFLSSLQHVDLSNDPILPLAYFGKLKGFGYENRICEFWQGPTGDRIYHFHEPYPNEPDAPTMAGAPPHLWKHDDIDHGFAFLFISASNPAWHQTIVKSFYAQFEKSTLYLGNGKTPTGGAFQDVPRNLLPLQESLRALNGQPHDVTVTVKIHCFNRFLAKVALGVGGIFLDASFGMSDDAHLLRTYLWTKDPENQRDIPIRGSGFFNVNQPLLPNIFGDGHTIMLSEIRGSLYLYVSLYETEGGICLTSDKCHWRNCPGVADTVYVIAPGLQRYIGPIELNHLIACRSGAFHDESISDFYNTLESTSPLPPRHC